jgi:hypothetical protein
MPTGPFAEIYEAEDEEEAKDMARKKSFNDPGWKRKEGSWWDIYKLCLLAPFIALYYLFIGLGYGISWFLMTFRFWQVWGWVRWKLKRRKRYQKLRAYRKHRDTGEWSEIGKILTYLNYMDDPGSLSELIDLFGVEPIEKAWLSGYFDVYNKDGFKIRLYDSETYRKNKGLA